MRASAQLCLVDGRLASDALLDGFIGWLGAGELARYRRFVRRERRRQFLIGRVLARQALGALLGVDPKGLIIEDVAGHRPVLMHLPAHFSISHSGPWVACAVSADTTVGLDVEVMDPERDIGALAAQAFGDECCAWLAARPDATRIRDFYMMWSANEARIKLGAPAAQTVEFFHPELSIVLCAARQLEQLPTLQMPPACGLSHPTFFSG